MITWSYVGEAIANLVVLSIGFVVGYLWRAKRQIR